MATNQSGEGVVWVLFCPTTHVNLNWGVRYRITTFLDNIGMIIDLFSVSKYQGK